MSILNTIVPLISELSVAEKQALLALLTVPNTSSKDEKSAGKKTKKVADQGEKKTRKPSAYNLWYKNEYPKYKQEVSEEDETLKGRELSKAVMVKMSSVWSGMSEEAKKKWSPASSKEVSPASSKEVSPVSSPKLKPEEKKEDDETIDELDNVLREIEELEEEEPKKKKTSAKKKEEEKKEEKPKAKGKATKTSK